MIKTNRSVVVLLTVVMKHVLNRKETNTRLSFTVQSFLNRATRSKTTFSRYYHFSFTDLVKKEEKIVSGFSKWKKIFFSGLWMWVRGCTWHELNDGIWAREVGWGRVNRGLPNPKRKELAVSN